MAGPRRAVGALLTTINACDKRKALCVKEKLRGEIHYAGTGDEIASAFALQATADKSSPRFLAKRFAFVAGNDGIA